MSEAVPGIVVAGSAASPSIFTARPEARKRLRDFFSSHSRNRNTRRAYMEAVHVAAFVERQLQANSRPTVKLRLAALRMLFDWLVVGQVMASNPAHAVRGPKYTQKKSKTPVLTPWEARELLDAIDIESVVGQRDRALIALMVYSFARVGAALGMRVEDFFVQECRGWVRLHEKGGKLHEMPTHHNLDKYLEDYIAAASIGDERKEPLFRTTRARTGELTDHAMLQSDVWRMIRRRAATGITAYLKNGGKLEIAQQMANHESARTTGLYDRRSDEISLDEVEKSAI